MIPYARIAGFLFAGEPKIKSEQASSGDMTDGMGREVQILSVGEDALTIRCADPVEQIKTIELHIYDDRDDCFDTVVLPDPVLAECRQEAFYVLYTFRILNEEYREAVRKLDAQYSHYVMKKLAQDDAALAEDYTGYPARDDARITTDFVTQRNGWYAESLCGLEHNASPKERCDMLAAGRVKCQWDRVLALESESGTAFTVALELDNPRLWEQYEHLPVQQLWEEYWTSHGLMAHPIAAAKPGCIYIGNAFCHLLLPEWERLEGMLMKAKQELLTVVIVTTYLRENRIDQMRAFYEKLSLWCEENQMPVEVEVNDWGTFELLKNKEAWLIPTLGILLNKRRKDPRMKYKIGFSDDEGTLAENSLNEAFYREYLEKNYGLTRFEQEACGYRIALPKGHNRLHLPYYQTNTSQYCPLYAMCHEGARGRQRMPQDCPQYCRDYVLSYPDHLHMVGRYNSLFGYDEKILSDPAILADYMEQGLERIVVNLI